MNQLLLVYGSKEEVKYSLMKEDWMHERRLLMEYVLWASFAFAASGCDGISCARRGGSGAVPCTVLDQAVVCVSGVVGIRTAGASPCSGASRWRGEDGDRLICACRPGPRTADANQCSDVDARAHARTEPHQTAHSRPPHAHVDPYPHIHARARIHARIKRHPRAEPHAHGPHALADLQPRVDAEPHAHTRAACVRGYTPPSPFSARATPPRANVDARARIRTRICTRTTTPASSPTSTASTRPS